MTDPNKKLISIEVDARVGKLDAFTISKVISLIPPISKWPTSRLFIASLFWTAKLAAFILPYNDALDNEKSREQIKFLFSTLFDAFADEEQGRRLTPKEDGE